jgi:hypothetical protein
VALGTVLAEGVDLSRMAVSRFLAGFTEGNRTSQAPRLPNHCAWNLGHLAWALNRNASRLEALIEGRNEPVAPGMGGLPESDFVDGPRGDAQRFGVGTISFGSIPADDPDAYPGLSRCVDIFNAACGRLSAACRRASNEHLAQPVPFLGQQMPFRAAVLFMIFHNGDHCGQITDMRRALGFPGVLG